MSQEEPPVVTVSNVIQQPVSVSPVSPDNADAKLKVIDFSRNPLDQQSTYMKLIAVDTFESGDFGIVLRRSSSHGATKKKKRFNSPKRPMSAGRKNKDEFPDEAPVVKVVDVSRMKLIVR